MKRRAYILVLSVIGTLLCADKMATKGAVTEGLFILKNKNLFVKKAIQDLKKELTACFQSKPGEKACKPSQLEIYHCKLKQLIYPTYIDELGVLAAHNEVHVKAIGDAERKIEKEVFDAYMKEAFLLTEKIDREKKLIAQIIKVDTLQKELSLMQTKYKGPDIKPPKPFTDLQAKVSNAKEAIVQLKKRINEINTQLFIGDLIQEVYLNNLAFYS